ncbi:uncharacterized protein LOC125855911 [Solanum stenotomum]|uniref:uncharacterized protein LOC125855911 n=1 Tax=Solanum stenotomum TaxID=172797 RepID=UPI0020D15A69|nr:uncharacterized protein LOC125855911 [Solanum stenotomum]
MGQLAYFSNRRAARLEASIPVMILASLDDVVILLSATIYAITAWIAVCEHGQGATEEVTTLKATIAALRRDVDQLKSSDMSMIFGTMEIPDVPVDPAMPPPTTCEDVRVEEAANTESEEKTDEEMLGFAEEGRLDIRALLRLMRPW